jgi:hypothetical protein
LPRAKAIALSEEKFFNECQIYALGEEQFFNERQIFHSRRRALLQRVHNIWLSAKEWPPLLTAGRAVTVRGPSTRAKDASQRISTERVEERSRRRELCLWSFNVRPSPRGSLLSAKTPNPVVVSPSGVRRAASSAFSLLLSHIHLIFCWRGDPFRLLNKYYYTCSYVEVVGQIYMYE